MLQWDKYNKYHHLTNKIKKRAEKKYLKCNNMPKIWVFNSKSMNHQPHLLTH